MKRGLPTGVVTEALAERASGTRRRAPPGRWSGSRVRSRAKISRQEPDTEKADAEE